MIKYLKDLRFIKAIQPYTANEQRASEYELAIMRHGLGTDKCKLAISLINNKYKKAMNNGIT